MKKIKFVLFCLICSNSLSAQSLMDEFYPVDAGHSYLEFSIKYMGYAQVKGRFETFSGMVRYNDDDLSKTSATINVKTESIDTDGEWRDKDLKSPGWFDVQKYPEMNFVSTSTEPTKDGFNMLGRLTIKDVTRDVVFQMNPPSGILKDSRADLQVIFTGRAKINRTAFGIAGERWSKVKEGITAVADEVDIEISILGKRYQEQNLAGFVRNPERPPGKLKEVYSKEGVQATLVAFDQLVQDEEQKINVNAMNILGNYLMVSGNVNDAVILFERNLAVFPDSQAAYNSLAEAYFRSGKIEEAKLLYEKLLTIDPENTSAKEILRHL